MHYECRPLSSRQYCDFINLGGNFLTLKNPVFVELHYLMH